MDIHTLWASMRSERLAIVEMSKYTYTRHLANSLGSPSTRFFLLQSLVLLGRPPLGLVVVIDALLVIFLCLSFFIRLRFPSTSSW